MAEVKKEFGEFRTTHQDSLSGNTGLMRTYSSRSLYRGVFGFNWCSHLDLKLSFEGDKVKYFDCESSRHLADKKTLDGIYIVLKKKSATYFFNPEGQLSHWIDSEKNKIYVIYKDGKIDQVFAKSQAPLKISYNSEGLVRRIGDSLEYEYQQGLLSFVRKNKKQMWRYQYDEFLNMTLWRGPSGSEEVKYDTDWDRVVFLKDTENCKYNFQYEIKNGKKWIGESKKCLAPARRQNSMYELVSPQELVKSPSDLLGKEFRQGATNESTF